MKTKMMGMAALAAALAASLAACGTNPQDRTAGGAATGAATGAGIGAFGGPVGALAGAAIGAGAGAVTGATTSPGDVNLGRPVWSNPEVRTPADRNRRQTAQRSRERPTSEADRAYMGGGMVVQPGGTASTSTPSPASGASTPMAPATGRSSGADIAPGATPGMRPGLEGDSTGPIVGPGSGPAAPSRGMP